VYLNSPANIIVGCNNEIALPALQQLFVTGSLKAVLVPEKNKELFSILQPLLAGSPVSLVSVNKKNLEPTIKTLATDKKITAAWLMTFPYIIPASALTLLPGGFINFHYGILPNYRGSNPILAQLLNGETHSGLTIHVVDEHIDTGPIILQQKIIIEAIDTFGMQLQKLGRLGASMAVNLLQFYHFGPVPPSVAQDESKAGYYKKVTASDLLINWDRMSSHQVNRMINACNPWNKGAGAMINNLLIRITAAEIMEDGFSDNLAPGTIVSCNEKEGLTVLCSDKKAIRISIFYIEEGFFTGDKLSGYGVKTGDKFISLTTISA
jgi:methionyl-tRNA formyltransferase